LLQVLSTSTLKNVNSIEQQRLVTLSSTDDWNSSFSTLMTHSILGAPVIDEAMCKCVGVLELKDFISYLVDLHDSTTKKECGAPIFGKTKTLMEYLKENPSISEDASIIDVLRIFVEYRLHRIPVVSTEDKTKVVSCVSQRTIIHWLWNNREKIGDCLQIPLSLIRQLKDLHSIHEDEPLINAFQYILNNKLSGVGVINSNGQINGNISTSTLLPSVKENLDLLDMPAKTFIEKCESARKLITCSKSDSLLQVVEKMVQEKVRRVFLVDEHNRPLGVVTQTDIMDCVVGLALASLLSLL